ncbi:MAG: helix-turn-helix transcriptional regulator [Actinomycetaceae bacterium]|nr:helix-turn-helix transcriptional regulator [Actinomycetaceae bacterium]
MADDGQEFAHILQGAITQSGKTLAQITYEVRELGSSISQASLSYWQSGRSIPRRQSSAKTLRALEKVLNVPRGTLFDAAALSGMPSEPEAEATFENTSRGMIVPEESLAVLEGTDLSNIDWDNEVERKAMRTNIRISNDGHLMEMTTLCIVALQGTDAPVFHVGSVWSEGNPPPELLEVVGGEVGESTVYPEENYSLREILLPKGYATGELRQVGWTYRQESAEKITRTPHRWFARPLETYAMNVAFEGDLPSRVEWVQTQEVTTGGFTQRIETSRELDASSGVARLALENVHDCTAYVRWTW